MEDQNYKGCQFKKLEERLNLLYTNVQEKWPLDVYNKNSVFAESTANNILEDYCDTIKNCISINYNPQVNLLMLTTMIITFNCDCKKTILKLMYEISFNPTVNNLHDYAWSIISTHETIFKLNMFIGKLLSLYPNSNYDNSWKWLPYVIETAIERQSGDADKIKFYIDKLRNMTASTDVAVRDYAQIILEEIQQQNQS